MSRAFKLMPTATPPPPVRYCGMALVADDEPIVLRLGQLMFRYLGFDVLTASNGRDALTTFASYREKIRIALLDLTMPVLNGVEVLQGIRSLSPSVPVILCSGYTDFELPDGVDSSFVSFLNKPYSATDLEKLVSEALVLVTA